MLYYIRETRGKQPNTVIKLPCLKNHAKHLFTTALEPCIYGRLLWRPDPAGYKGYQFLLYTRLQPQ